MFGDERGEKSFSLMHLYVKTVCMTQYKTFKQFVGLFLYLPNVWNHCTRVILRKKKLNTEIFMFWKILIQKICLLYTECLCQVLGSMPQNAPSCREMTSAPVWVKGLEGSDTPQTTRWKSPCSVSGALIPSRPGKLGVWCCCGRTSGVEWTASTSTWGAGTREVEWGVWNGEVK